MKTLQHLRLAIQICYMPVYMLIIAFSVLLKTPGGRSVTSLDEISLLKYQFFV